MNYDTPKSGHSIRSGSIGSSKPISTGNQDAIIEQLRQQHKQIVAEGRKRLVGQLMKHSIREAKSQIRLPSMYNRGDLQGESSGEDSARYHA